MSDAVRLCLIGAGRHASRNIYPCLHFLQGAEVAANADLELPRAEAAAAAFGIPRSYDDYHAMLDAEQPDGVIICVGPEFHASAAIELMEAGYHVYTEKPNAPTFARSRQVLAVQRRTGRVCMVGYKKRFAPAYREARAVIDSEDFGEPSLLTLLRTAWHKPDADPMREHLLGWGCHTLDLTTWLFGPVRQVAAWMTPGPAR
ncbi:MAG: Gfo/Idh/MocA family protein [Planctomycetota bacterium]